MRKRGTLLTLFSALFLFLAFGLALAATAQAAGPGPGTPGFPATINYQGMLRRADGKPISGTHTIRISIYDAPVSGTTLYTEDFSNVAVRDGVFNVVLGADPANPLNPSVFNTCATLLRD